MISVKAAVATAPHRPLVFQDLDLVEPRGEEILVRTVASGVCHTDLLARDQSFGPALPAVLGHEGAGVVEAVGPSVRNIKVGDHVLLTQASCGSCNHCRTAHPMNCENYERYNMTGRRSDGRPTFSDPGIQGGFVGQSSFATHMLGYESNSVVIPRDFPLEHAAPLGCGLVTGASAVSHVQRPRTGASMLVIGAGAVGMAAIMTAHMMGCSPIIAVDLNTQRRDKALELGATHALDGADPEVVEQIIGLSGRGVEFAIDAAGLPVTLENALKSSAPGAHIVLLGAIGIGQAASIDILSLVFNRKIQGAIQGDQIPQIMIPQLVAWHRAGRFPHDRLIDIYAFEQINTALEELDKGQSIKPVLRFP